MDRKSYKSLLPAVRAFARLYSLRCKPLQEGERADYGFDHGEFSGCHYDDAYQRVWDETADEVASRFGVDRMKLSNGYTRWSHADMAHLHGYTDYK
jgi:hypothetical protein